MLLLGWGDADVDHTQTIGGNTAKLLGRYIPSHPPHFGTPVWGLYFRVRAGFWLQLVALFTTLITKPKLVSPLGL